MTYSIKTVMEREDSPETNSIREQSLEGHGYEVRGTQSGNVREFHLLGKLQGISGQRAFQNTGRQKGTQLAENVLNGSELYLEMDSALGWLHFDHRT